MSDYRTGLFGLRPAAFGFPDRGDSSFDFRTNSSRRDLETESSLVMPALKMANSGLFSNRLELNGGECASRALVAFGLFCPSTMLSHRLFPDQFSIRQSTSADLFHSNHKPLRVRHLAVVKTKRLFINIAEQVKGSSAM
jgi:hypothetical protein